MKRFPDEFPRIVAVLLCALLSVSLTAALHAQQQEPPAPPPPGQTLTPDQLDDLVAPIALYPDPLVSQVLVAATYPLELVQAYQWMQRNPGISGPALTQAAQQQNWDPSIQALIIFPDVMKRLNDDVTWTTNLGNAFLAQQPDVMDAVQRMRLKAQQAGKLQSTPQQTVTTANEGGQPIVEIEPANPEVIYVPVYDPAWIWGPPLWYPYPRWIWGPRPAAGFYFGFGGGISIGAYFGGGWGGWGGWGWHPGWGNHTVIVNNTFIHRYNFNTAHIANVHGNTAWTHDVAHRGGVPYASPALNQQYRGNMRQNLAPQGRTEQARPSVQPMDRVGNRDVPRSAPPARNGSAFGGMENGRAAQMHSDHGAASLGPSRMGGGGARSAPARGGGGGRHR
jgi:hypothetical protein